MRSILVALIATVLALVLPGQTTWYVDASAPIGGNGTPAAPFTSIQSAVDASVNGDSILVAPGSYTPVVIAKDVALSSTQGPTVTVIGPFPYPHPAMRINSTTSACVIDGFTLAGCHGLLNSNCTHGTAGGLHIENASPIIKRCIIRNNTGGAGMTYCSPLGPVIASGHAGGVEVLGPGSTPALENCVIAHNTGGPGNIYCASLPCITFPAGTGGVSIANSAVLRNCTISSNVGGANFAGRGGLSGPATLVNVIVWGNSAGSPGGSPPGEELAAHCGYVPFCGSPPTATWCDVRGGYPGAGNFDANPGFVNPAGFDFRLSNGSPCVDTGAPSLATHDLDGVARPQYLGTDVGAYEWQPPESLVFSLSQTDASAISIATIGGTPGAVYVGLFTDDATNTGALAGTGPWGGLFMSAADVVAQINLAVPPFYGTLGPGGWTVTATALPPGLTGIVIYAISHTLGAVHVSRRSPIAVVTLL